MLTYSRVSLFLYFFFSNEFILRAITKEVNKVVRVAEEKHCWLGLYFSASRSCVCGRVFVQLPAQGGSGHHRQEFWGHRVIGVINRLEELLV